MWIGRTNFSTFGPIYCHFWIGLYPDNVNTLFNLLKQGLSTLYLV